MTIRDFLGMTIRDFPRTDYPQYPALALEGPDGLRDLESGITLPSVVLIS
jgi:hypothetical protein